MKFFRSKNIQWWLAGICVLGLLAIGHLLPLSDGLDYLKHSVSDLGCWGPLVFGLVYVVATIGLIPASALTMAGAAVFGPVIGFVTVSVSSIIGAAIAFLIARYLARDKIEQLARRYPKFAAFDQAISTGGWKVLALLRLSPAIPFGLQNYLHGLTTIGFGTYVLVSWLAMIPGILLYVYLGHAARTAASGSGSTAKWMLLTIGLLATIVVTVYLSRLAKQKLNEVEDDESSGVSESS